MKQLAKTATDANGQRIRVGDSVEIKNVYKQEWTGRIVKVVEMYRQGYDGTILRCDPVPDPYFRHHDTHRARDTRKV